MNKTPHKNVDIYNIDSYVLFTLLTVGCYKSVDGKLTTRYTFMLLFFQTYILMEFNSPDHVSHGLWYCTFGYEIMKHNMITLGLD